MPEDFDKALEKKKKKQLKKLAESQAQIVKTNYQVLIVTLFVAALILFVFAMTQNSITVRW